MLKPNRHDRGASESRTVFYGRATVGHSPSARDCRRVIEPAILCRRAAQRSRELRFVAPPMRRKAHSNDRENRSGRVESAAATLRDFD
jgi:hypothetical protein